MKKLKVNLYGKDTEPTNGVSNRYKTSKFAFQQPALHYVVGSRGQGKSRLTSKILSQAQKEKTFDVIYLISPSFESNRAYFGKLINENNVFKPTKESIQQVIDRVDEDRDEFEEHLRLLEEYKRFNDILKSGREMTDDELSRYIVFGFLDEDFEKPVFKYEEAAGVLRVPTSCVVLDDVLGSRALCQSSGIDKLCSLNRHISPLSQPFGDRSACGLAVYILSQTYRCPNGIGRLVRENITHLTLFKNKQNKQVDLIKDELASTIEEDKFMSALEYSTNKKYGNLTITFTPPCPTHTFRSNLNELLIFDGMECSCGR